jgi:hypothetical protein
MAIDEIHHLEMIGPHRLGQLRKREKRFGAARNAAHGDSPITNGCVRIVRWRRRRVSVSSGERI